MPITFDREYDDQGRSTGSNFQVTGWTWWLGCVPIIALTAAAVLATLLRVIF